MNFEIAKYWQIAPLALALCGACNDNRISPAPAFADGGTLRLGVALELSSLPALEARYQLSSGTELLGSDVVLTTGFHSISLLSGKDAAVVALEAACLDGERVILEGHWRYPRGYEVGLMRLEVKDRDNARALCAGQAPRTPLTFEGTWGKESATPNRPIRLSFSSELEAYHGRFFSVAHHGACEVQDSCGLAPNSLETILLSEKYGANGMEVDVRITSDGVPILFHDPKFGGYTTQGIFCQGSVEKQSLESIQANCRLSYGERVPTMESALDLLIDRTLMEVAYLDMKVPGVVAPAARLAATANERAADQGRKFVSVIALTTDDITDAWRDFVSSTPPEEVPPCLMEYDPDLVSELGCVAWGPTWTAGPRADDVTRVRASGGKVIYWTLHDDNIIDEFLQATHPDGVITSRTGLVMYRYHSLKTLPPLSTRESSSEETDKP